VSVVESADLGGLITARPGQPLPTLTSTRREWAAQLARGRPALALPDLLSSLYALCGGAHRVAAHLAVAAATGQPTVVDAESRQALRADTLREHLRRMWLDWPRVLPLADDAGSAAALASCPLLRDVAAVDASRDWVEQQVLGMPAADWLTRWGAARGAFVEAWAEQGATFVARWLREARPACLGLNVPSAALAVHASTDELAHLAAQLRDDDGFALRPLWRGYTAETGPWTRLADRPCHQGSDASVFMRLAARVADVAHLVAAGGEAWLALGAAGVGPCEGLAWCEMARGLLVHWVRLDSSGDATPRVAAARVLAPTEWNFHPYGALARLLSDLPPRVAPSRVRLLAAAFDPCVGLAVEPAVASPPQDAGTR
jgi:hypothetical protein